jgi:hypothetical protein
MQIYKKVLSVLVFVGVLALGLPKISSAALIPPGVLTVIKHVINDDGGTAVASDFTMTINGPTALPSNSFPGQEDPGTTSVIVTDPITGTGTYNVTESGPAGYSATFSADCSGTIALGQAKTCTVTNDDIPPTGTLTVIKHVVNNYGGTAVASDFTMTINGVTAQDGNSFPGSETGTVKTITTFGSYNVTESGPAGYVGTFSTDCSGTIAAGQSKTCTVINNDTPPSPPPCPNPPPPSPSPPPPKYY